MQNSTTAKTRLGIFGGTFDPIHLGHIIPASDLAKQLTLDTIYLMPAHIPPHKSETSVNALHRSAMVSKVCQQQPLFKLDQRELKRSTPSYTIDSIKELIAEQPNSVIYFFIGADSLLALPSWHKVEELLTLCHFVVCARPGYQLDTLNDAVYNNRLTTSLNDLRANDFGKIYIAETQQLDISSTQLRAALKNQSKSAAESTCKFNKYLPLEVYNYIKLHNLYQE